MAKVVTGKVRFSYAQVFEPRAMPNSTDLKYSVSILIDKNDKATLRKIKAAIEAAKEEGKAKWGGKIPSNLRTPLRDGDIDRSDRPEYEDKMFINASSKRPPGIVDENKDPIFDKNEFYSGCYGRASVNFYAFDVNGNRGIAAGLNNLQKLEDGPRLDGGTTPEEDFADEYEDDYLD